MPLRERVARAQDAKADLFLSIHADSHPDPYVRGASVYTLSEDASDREAAALAARENRADLHRLEDRAASPILSPETLVAMTPAGNRQRLRAVLPIRSSTPSARAASACCRTRTGRQASLSLHRPTFPPALVELGYLSNPQDEKLLTVYQHQMALARSLRGSVDAYFGAQRRHKKGVSRRPIRALCWTVAWRPSPRRLPC